MSQLNDYSGKLIPNVNFEDFSKETLVELLKVYSKLYLSVDGFWYLSGHSGTKQCRAKAIGIRLVRAKKVR